MNETQPSTFSWDLLEPAQQGWLWFAEEARPSALFRHLQEHMEEEGMALHWTSQHDEIVEAERLVAEIATPQGVRALRDKLRAQDTVICWLLPDALASQTILSFRHALDRVLPVDTPAPWMIRHLKQMTHQIKQMMRTQVSLDALTGVSNKKTFYDKLQRILRNPRLGEAYSLLSIDVDHFKRLNDQFGHTVGDRVLVEIAQSLQVSCPPMCLLGRIGGEEFGVFLQADQQESLELAERLRVAISKHMAEARESEAFEDLSEVTVSIGVATIGAQHPNKDTLIRAADQALYAAKARGRNRAIHEEQLAEEAMKKGSRLELETFENMTRVLTERIGEVIAWRGRRLFEQIREQADLDPITGLYSRRYLDRRLAFEFESMTRDGCGIALALLDIDHFGSVNKTYGWPTGDKVLTGVAEHMKQCVRKEDWVARYGGEEFCVIMHQCSHEQMGIVLERLRRTIEEATFHSTKDESLKITVSIGGALSQESDKGLETLLERASEQLLAAKRGGRNRVCLEH